MTCAIFLMFFRQTYGQSAVRPCKNCVPPNRLLLSHLKEPQCPNLLLWHASREQVWGIHHLAWTRWLWQRALRGEGAIQGHGRDLESVTSFRWSVVIHVRAKETLRVCSRSSGSQCYGRFICDDSRATPERHQATAMNTVMANSRSEVQTSKFCQPKFVTYHIHHSYRIKPIHTVHIVWPSYYWVVIFSPSC